jgi:carbamoyltransferase
MGSPSWILGLNHGPHDSSAALLRDGRLVAVAEQERFSRRKRALDEPPVDAMRYCLQYAGIGLGDVECVALGFDFALMRAWLGLEPHEATRALPYDDPVRLFPAQLLAGGKPPPTEVIAHHTAHAASAYWASGFGEAAVLVADDMGEDVSTTLGYGSPTGLTVLETYPVAQSLGMYYSRAARYVGLYERSGEVGKFMGLASYGVADQPVPLTVAEGRYCFDILPQLANDLPGALVRRKRSGQLLEFFEQHCFPYTRDLTADIMSYAAFAASVQRSLEEALLELARRLHELTNSPNLVLAGGVALNCTANGALVRDAGYDRVFVQPMAGDSGVALGAALAAHVERYGSDSVDSPMCHAYYGPEYTHTEIASALSAAGVDHCRYPEGELIERVAELLSWGRVVGWFQGRAEVGPRALGARSILADPRHRKTLVRLNQIKGREMWRPVAPSVLERDWHDYFYSSRPDPFMVVAARVRRNRWSEIPAVVHVDGSARPQAVNPENAPRFAALIEAFGRRTRVPVLANTSFNLADEPIVNTPADAVRTFLRGGLDVLAIDDTLVVRPGAEEPDATTAESEDWW